MVVLAIGNFLARRLGRDRVSHASSERIWRESELDASDPATRIVLLDHRDQLLAAGDGQLLTGELGPLQLLEEVIHVDLLEQESTRIQNVVTLADHVVLHGQELVRQGSTVGVSGGQNLEFTLTVEGELAIEL